MSVNTIKAWKDADYRNSLSTEELALVAANPAGLIELNDEDLMGVAGGKKSNKKSGSKKSGSKKSGSKKSGSNKSGSGSNGGGSNGGGGCTICMCTCFWCK